MVYAPMSVGIDTICGASPIYSSIVARNDCGGYRSLNYQLKPSTKIYTTQQTNKIY